LSRREQQVALMMFDSATEWIQPSNAERNRDARDTLKGQIVAWTNKSRELSCEMYMQLI